MAEFPSNFGDGEVWVSSDILQNERYYPQFPSELTYMEELAQQISAYALLERRSLLKAVKPPPSPAPPNPNLLLPANLEIRQPNRYVSIAHHNPSLGLGLGGGGSGGGCNVGCCHHHLHHHHHDVYVSSGNGGSQFGSRPVYQYPTSKPPAETQVGNIVQARATILQRQQQMQNHTQNRFLPIQVSRSWMGGSGGFGRESGGTGVFLPRVSTTHDSSSAAATAARRKQQSMRNGGEETKHRGPVKKVAVGKQDQVSAEMGLPSDWTY